MLQRFASLGKHARRACHRCNLIGSLKAQEGAVATQISSGQNCTCSTKFCAIHGSAYAPANPDNKPPPSGKDRNDPTNVKYDTPTKDPDDTSDFAPGYYDEKGEGGHRRVASQKDSKQVPDHVVGGEPKAWKPQEADDPNLPKPKDPNSADIPSDLQGKENAHSRKQENPNEDPPVDKGSAGSMPDQETELAGMPKPDAPPASTSTQGARPDQQAQSTDTQSPFGNPASLANVEKPAQQVVDEGLVEEGAPSKPGPEETHLYR